MQAINRLLSQNCNCYPHLFRCSTIKIHNSFQLPLKPSVALLSSHFNTLFSFQGAISSFFEARSQNPISWVLRSNSKLDLVGPSGLEPPTLRLSVVRSSQLSYGPVRRCGLHIVRCNVHVTAHSFHRISSSNHKRFAGLRFELNENMNLVEIVGIEPATSCLQGRRSPS